MLALSEHMLLETDECVCRGLMADPWHRSVAAREKFKGAAKCIKFHLLFDEASNACQTYSWFS